MTYLRVTNGEQIMNTKQWRCNATRLSLISFSSILGCGLYLASGWMNSEQLGHWNPDGGGLKERKSDWRSHPALAEPDGQSHRHGRMLGDKINDPRVLDELSRRFRATRELRFVKSGDAWKLEGGGDFEYRQEYFLRLLDYYWFSKDRLTGMTRHKIESIFGPGGLERSQRSGRLSWSAGRDMLIADIENNRVVDAQYVMGY
jgi:hypothetical protein